jgi:hypothetical protein
MLAPSEMRNRQRGNPFHPSKAAAATGQQAVNSAIKISTMENDWRFKTSRRIDDRN